MIVLITFNTQCDLWNYRIWIIIKTFFALTNRPYDDSGQPFVHTESVGNIFWHSWLPLWHRLINLRISANSAFEKPMIDQTNMKWGSGLIAHPYNFWWHFGWNTLCSSDTAWRQSNGKSLVLVMACRVCRASSLLDMNQNTQIFNKQITW